MYFRFGRRCSSLSIIIWLSLAALLCASIIWDFNRPCISPVENRKRLAYTVKAFNEIMTELNVTHWTDYGTLLGALRYENIIIWDHDADVSYDQKFADLLQEGGPAQTIAKKRYNIYLNADFMLYEGMQTDIFTWKKVSSADAGYIYTKATNRNLEFFETQFNDFNASFIEKTVLIPFAGGFIRAPYPPMEFIKKRYPTSYNRYIPFKVSCYFPWNIPHWLMFNQPIHKIN